jgi:hypothetical protein
MTTSTAVSTFAMQTILLGEGATVAGPPSPTAWQAFGYDLDGLVTTTSSKNVCTLTAGAPPSNQLDGNDGIDNAWGNAVLPIIESALAGGAPSAAASAVLAAGGWTLQIQITGLSADPAQSARGLDAQLFVSGPLGAMPAFDQTTDWPVLPSSLADGATIAGGALVHFTNVYVVAGTLVATGASQPMLLPLVVNWEIFNTSTPVSLPLIIHDPTLTFVHATPNAASHGIIAGLLDMQALITALQTIAAYADQDLCPQTYVGFIPQIQQAQDILTDATNKPGLLCDAISIGLGFTASLVANPTLLGTDPPPKFNPCDAGPD